MSLELFSNLLVKCDLTDASQKWFPVWVKQLATFQNCTSSKSLLVEREIVIQFLRSLRDSNVPAWQRLQAVHAIECYTVLGGN